MREWLWPTRCAGCGVEGRGAVCSGCVPPAVHRAPVPVGSVQGAFVLTGWDQPLGRALATAKYGNHRALMASLAAAFADRMAPALNGHPFDAIVPVPSAWTRRVSRGFSPAALMSHALSRRVGVPWVSALTMQRGAKQATLRAPMRHLNLRGRVRSVRSVPGTVLLVDDIWTTGATLDACTRELLGDRTEAVWVAALCTRRPDDQS